jgi:hypothetical protein
MKTCKAKYLITATLALAAGGFGVYGADWGSIRGNNRSEAQSRGGQGWAPASRPEAARPAPEVRRPEARTERRAPVVSGREEERRSEHIEHREVHVGRSEGRPPVVHETRHWDIDEDRHHSYFWFGFHPGMVIGTLPLGYSQVYVGGNPYYYDQGVYYQPGSSGYVVVNPPVGALVAQLPPGAEAIQVGPTVYYYVAGAFYVQQPQGYAVVAPPLGITVGELPPAATQVVVNGRVYYQADGAYFQPVMQNGVTVYMTAQP